MVLVQLVPASRTAGAVIMGKTVTTEFATYQPGPTANPRVAAGAEEKTPSSLPADVGIAERVATLLGDSARLFERVEFTELNVPPHPPEARRSPPERRSRRAPSAPATPPVPPAPPGPPGWTSRSR